MTLYQMIDGPSFSPFHTMHILINADALPNICVVLCFVIGRAGAGGGICSDRLSDVKSFLDAESAFCVENRLTRGLHGGGWRTYARTRAPTTAGASLSAT